MIRMLFLGGLLAGLTGCASYTERTSPCVCDWQPINALEDGAVVPT